MTEVRNLCVYRCEKRLIFLNGCCLCSIQIMNFVHVVVIIPRPTSQQGKGIVLFGGGGEVVEGLNLSSKFCFVISGWRFLNV